MQEFKTTVRIYTPNIKKSKYTLDEYDIRLHQVDCTKKCVVIEWMDGNRALLTLSAYKRLLRNPRLGFCIEIVPQHVDSCGRIISESRWINVDREGSRF